ncbi:hypothetical protein NQ318_014262 [Aromia moschata]|uniref:Zinc finger protein n=1 Tax=Aromia moschata TaxID=1265417 RepID=A0AAV8YZ43_9CUCU|nr:hypothetical protein NQ318_014262 [Aromia moschata]
MDMSVYLTAPLQLDKICRACLTEKGDMRPLFGACLDEMLHSFASIEVSEGDGFPNLMCVQCVLQCSRAYTFKQQCEKSDSILRQYLSPEFQQQLAQSIADQQQTKSELQEQLQFTDHINNVVIEEDISEFVTYNEDDHLDVKEGIYTIETSEQENDNDEGHKLDESHDGEQEKLKYPCSKCEMSFSLKVDLKVHMMTHPKDLVYVCNVCNKGFAEARILKRHLKIHLEQKPHQCDQCDMSFAESSNLSKHKKKHTGELRNIKGKPHLCSVCGRAFKWASSLSKHMKYHTGHKLLSCDYCGKQYVEMVTIVK